MGFSKKNKNIKKKPQQPTSVGGPSANVTKSVETTSNGTDVPRVSKVSSFNNQLGSNPASSSVDLGSAGSSTTVTARSSTVARTSTTATAVAATKINIAKSSVGTVPGKPDVSRASRVSSVDNKLDSSPASSTVDLGSAGSSARSSTTSRNNTTAPASAAATKINVPNPSEKSTLKVTTVEARMQAKTLKNTKKKDKKRAKARATEEAQKVETDQGMGFVEAVVEETGAIAIKAVGHDTTVEVMNDGAVGTSSGSSVVGAEVAGDTVVAVKSTETETVETTATLSVVKSDESNNVEVSARATGVDAAWDVKANVIERNDSDVGCESDNGLEESVGRSDVKSEATGLAIEGGMSSENMEPAVSMVGQKELERKAEESAIEEEDESIVVSALEATKLRLELELARILEARDQVVHLSVVHGHTISIIKRGLVELNADPDKVYRVAEVEALKEQGYLVAAQVQDEAVVTVSTSTTASQKNDTTVLYGLLDYDLSVVAAEVEAGMKMVVATQSFETIDERIRTGGSSSLGQPEIGNSDENISIQNDATGSSSASEVEDVDVEACMKAVAASESFETMDERISTSGNSGLGQAEIGNKDENMTIQDDASGSSSATEVDATKVEAAMKAVAAFESVEPLDDRIGSGSSSDLGQTDSASSDTNSLIQPDSPSGLSSMDEIVEVTSAPTLQKDTSVRYGLFHYPSSVIAAEVETGMKSVAAATASPSLETAAGETTASPASIALGQQDLVSSNMNKSIAIEDAISVTTENSEVAETVGKVVRKDKGEGPVAIREDMLDSENESKDKVDVVAGEKRAVADLVYPMAGQSAVKEGENPNSGLNFERNVLDNKVREPAVEEGLGLTAMESKRFGDLGPSVEPKMKVEHKSDVSHVKTSESNTKAAHVKAEIARLNREIENATKILGNEKRVYSFQACVLKHFEAQFEAIKARKSVQVTKVAAPAESTLVSSTKDEAVDGQDDWPAAKVAFAEGPNGRMGKATTFGKAYRGLNWENYKMKENHQTVKPESATGRVDVQAVAMVPKQELELKETTLVEETDQSIEDLKETIAGLECAREQVEHELAEIKRARRELARRIAAQRQQMQFLKNKNIKKKSQQPTSVGSPSTDATSSVDITRNATDVVTKVSSVDNKIGSSAASSSIDVGSAGSSTTVTARSSTAARTNTTAPVGAASKIPAPVNIGNSSVETVPREIKDARLSNLVDDKKALSNASSTVDVGSAGSSARSSTTTRNSTAVPAGAATKIDVPTASVSMNKPGPGAKKGSLTKIKVANTENGASGQGGSPSTTTSAGSDEIVPVSVGANQTGNANFEKSHNTPDSPEKSATEIPTTDARKQAKTLQNKKKKNKKRAKALVAELTQKVEADQGEGFVEAAIKETGSMGSVDGDTSVKVVNDGAVGTSTSSSVVGAEVAVDSQVVAQPTETETVEGTAISSVVESEESRNLDVSQRATGAEQGRNEVVEKVDSEDLLEEKLGSGSDGDAMQSVEESVVKADMKFESAESAKEGGLRNERLEPAVSTVEKRESERKVEISTIEEADEAIAVCKASIASLDMAKLQIELEIASALEAPNELVRLSVADGQKVQLVRRDLEEMSVDWDEASRIAHAEALKECGYLCAAQDEAVKGSTTSPQNDTAVRYGLLDYPQSIIAAEVDAGMKTIAASQSFGIMDKRLSADTNALGHAEIEGSEENLSIQVDTSGSSSAPEVEAVKVETGMTASQTFEIVDERIGDGSIALPEADSASSVMNNSFQHDPPSVSSSVDEIAKAASTPSPQKDTTVRYGLLDYAPQVIAAEAEAGVKASAASTSIQVAAGGTTAVSSAVSHHNTVSSNKKTSAKHDVSSIRNKSQSVETVGKIVKQDKGKGRAVIREDKANSECDVEVVAVTEAKSLVWDRAHPMASQTGVRDVENINHKLDTEGTNFGGNMRDPAVEEGLGSTGMESKVFGELGPVVAVLPTMEVESKADVSETAESMTLAAYESKLATSKADIDRLKKVLENANKILKNEQRAYEYQACYLKHLEAQRDAAKARRTAEMSQVSVPGKNKDDEEKSQDDWPAARLAFAEGPNGRMGKATTFGKAYRGLNWEVTF
ncbi:hypothetical protein HDU76_003942 [Blyttiomyces sp. JEL0837]|nr:hypothetical protein HDU76_003942 [Blyttiomyces sp. JEL0837]